MDTSFKPVLSAPAISHDGGIRFMRKDDQIDIPATIANTVWNILEYCNGVTDVDDIILLMQDQTDGQTVRKIINDLHTLHVVVDSRELYRCFHDVSNNPSPYVYNLSQDDISRITLSPRASIKSGKVYQFHTDTKSAIRQLQSRRKSVRSFSDTPLTLDQVGTLCSIGYGLDNKATASGGGLYPLKIYVTVRHSTNSLSSGYYEYDPETDLLVRYKDLDQEALNFIFSTSRPLFNAPVQIVIAADMARQTQKYANRGYRLTLIEVGQVAQNITLAAIEMGLASCELGGALDDYLAAELEMEENVLPILAVAVGIESSEMWTDDATTYLPILDKIRSKHDIVEQVGIASYAESSFYCAYAASSNDDDVSGATSTSDILAKTKAAVEAYERHTSRTPGIGIVATARSLNCKWLDPRRVAPLSDEQAERLNLSIFTEDTAIEWTFGYGINRDRVAVPMDLVYYGYYHSDTNRILWGNSSGIAAHTNYNEAVTKATLELIERDSIMRMWFSQTPPRKVSVDLLGTHLQRRTEYWMKHGRSVYFLAPRSSYATTILCAITGNQYPGFVCGSAAAPNLVDAALKAFQEAEFALTVRLHSRQPLSTPMNKVSSPTDHGNYYSLPKNARKLSWMWNDATELYLPSNTPTWSTNSVLHNLNATVVDMTKDDNIPVYVVRVISEQLIPIAFGYGNDHYLHSTVNADKAQGRLHFLA